MSDGAYVYDFNFHPSQTVEERGGRRGYIEKCCVSCGGVKEYFVVYDGELPHSSWVYEDNLAAI